MQGDSMVMVPNMVMSKAAGKPGQKAKFGENCGCAERIAGMPADFRRA